MNNKKYLENQFKILVNTEYGFKIKISDGEGNATNYLNITSNDLQNILKTLTNEENNNEQH